MIISICRHCGSTLHDGRSAGVVPFGITALCPAAKPGERFPCEPRTDADRMTDDNARRANRPRVGKKRR
jgi:hypothetical protein